MPYGMEYGETYIGWGAGGRFYHVMIEKKDRTRRTACGVRPELCVAPSKTKGGPGCAKCMAWAKKHGVQT